MSANLINRYLWIIDTIGRHGSITMSRLSELWERSEFGDGEPLPRRTFYRFRQAIEQIFNISIRCRPNTYEYYLASAVGDAGSDIDIGSRGQGGEQRNDFLDWMLSAATMGNVMANMQRVSDRVFLEPVPSARLYLSLIVDAMCQSHALQFSYQSYTRSQPVAGLSLEPYFLKIFRQRWYVTGRNVADNKVKTYALDRMSGVTITSRSFDMPVNFDAADYVRDAFGIVFSEGVVHTVKLRVEPRRAKYFRALPLHASQAEMVTDSYSIFTYRLRITPDLVQELLSYGADVTVLQPGVLRSMIMESLNASLRNYQSDVR